MIVNQPDTSHSQASCSWLLASSMDAHVRAQETRGAAGPSAAADSSIARCCRSRSPLLPHHRAGRAQSDGRRFEVKAPQGAPNVVIVLIDDLGFGQPSTFGGGVAMPTLDRLAAGGLRYNQFHTTALCSPTRVALKYGRNHHSANAGSVMEIATALPRQPGPDSQQRGAARRDAALNGYNTAAFGKWHETAPWEVSVSGPRTAGPPARDSRNSTASSAARPTSGRR